MFRIPPVLRIPLLAGVTWLAASGSAALGQNELATLTAPDAASGDNFGQSVAALGDLVLIGSPKDFTTGTNRGSAHLFRFDGVDWMHETQLLAFDAANGDEFGTSVALANDNGVELAFVGAWLDDSPLSNAGSVYVFRNELGGWVLEQKLVAGDAAISNGFGWSVAADGNTVLVGALDGDVPGVANCGTVYVYQRSGQSWGQITELSAFDAANLDDFGSSVAISGDTAIVGAPKDDLSGGFSDAGSAYVFTRTGSIWSFHQKLTHPSPSGFDEFGFSVAIDGDAVVAGAPFDESDNRGSAHVFRAQGGSWSLEQSLTASDAMPNINFGHATAVRGGTVIVSAPVHLSTGALYTFTYAGSWSQTAMTIPIFALDFGRLGHSVAMNSNLLLIAGAPTDAGTAYLFQVQTGSTDSDGDGLTDDFEAQIGTNPFNPDSDGDGVDDGTEYNDSQFNNGCPNPLDPDSDDDGLSDGYEYLNGPNPCDPDVDDDGLNDGAEATHGTNPIDPDTDDDNLADGLEIAHGTNPLNPDTDSDGLGDGQEVQLAGGGNCPNPLLSDSDGDGLSDGVEHGLGLDPCNADSDGDNLSDSDEAQYGTDPFDPDSDDDGMPDGAEVALAAGGHCPHPLNGDSDGDGILDGDEVMAGLGPCDADSDNDGLSDGNEDTHGTDPLNPDTDGDGLLDGTEVDIALGSGCPSPLVPDSDGDTLLDGAETANGTNPCSGDTDGDGFGDDVDPTPNQAGVPADFLANITQATAAGVLDLDQSLFMGPNANARIARRTVIAATMLLASGLIDNGNYTAARALLTVVRMRVDGASPPPDWMSPSSTQATLNSDLQAIIILLDMLN